MIAIQIGIIIFLVSVLAIIYLDGHKKRQFARKSVKLDRFWEKDKDRRKSLRINTKLDVSYEVVSDGRTLKHTSVSRNISAGGINLALNEKLVPGTTLYLQLNIPQSPKAIFAYGQIVWAEEISGKFSGQGGERLFSTGIKFTHVKPGDATALRDFINQRIRNVTDKNQEA